MASSTNEAALNKRGVTRWVLSFMVVSAAITCFTYWMNSPQTLPIKNVRIESEFQHVSQQELTEELSDLVQTGYFSMDATRIITAAKSLPWVKHAKVRRVWPDTIVVSVTEQKVVARWNDESLLNLQGEVFTPRVIEGVSDLPRLYGVDKQSHLVLEKFLKAGDMSGKSELAMSVLEKAEHGSWTAELKNGTKVLIGKVDPVVAMNRGLQVLALAENKVLAQIEVLDLRYPNGLSVVWKEGVKPKRVMIGSTTHGIEHNQSKEG